MDKLPLRRVAEVAFLASNLSECVSFYRKIGLELSANPAMVNFSSVGEQLFGIADEKRGWFDGRGFVKPPMCSRLHVAFEVPADRLDECISFLEAKRVKVSPKHESDPGFHSAPHSTSVYFSDPAGNIIELWAPSR